MCRRRRWRWWWRWRTRMDACVQAFVVSILLEHKVLGMTLASTAVACVDNMLRNKNDLQPQRTYTKGFSCSFLMPLHAHMYITYSRCWRCAMDICRMAISAANTNAENSTEKWKMKLKREKRCNFGFVLLCAAWSRPSDAMPTVHSLFHCRRANLKRLVEDGWVSVSKFFRVIPLDGQKLRWRQHTHFGECNGNGKTIRMYDVRRYISHLNVHFFYLHVPSSMVVRIK